MIPSYLPSPHHGVWHLGPIPLRAYALIILTGIFVAVWLGNRRWVARGGRDGQIADVAIWAVPFGVIGGRVYHVLTDWSAYFGDGGKGFLGALRIWEGGLGIWGAIALGALGAWIGCSRHGVPFAPFADSIAPGIAIAQAIGRWGNWFNQELFGKPTTVQWALTIDPQNRPAGFEQYATFHPTFLYESIACIAIAVIVMWADKRFVLGHGRAFAVYVAMYCAARGLIETLRIDEAHHIFGVRLNVFTALIVGFGALGYLVRSSERHPGREVMEHGKVIGNLVPAEISRGRRARVAGHVESPVVADTPVADTPAADAPVAFEPDITSTIVARENEQVGQTKQRGRRIKGR